MIKLAERCRYDSHTHTLPIPPLPRQETEDTQGKAPCRDGHEDGASVAVSAARGQGASDQAW